MRLRLEFEAPLARDGGATARPQKGELGWAPCLGQAPPSVVGPFERRAGVFFGALSPRPVGGPARLRPAPHRSWPRGQRFYVGGLGTRARRKVRVGERIFARRRAAPAREPRSDGRGRPLIARVVEFCARHPWYVIALALLAAIAGDLGRRHLAHDVLPDFVRPADRAIAEWMGHPASPTWRKRSRRCSPKSSRKSRGPRQYGDPR